MERVISYEQMEKALNEFIDSWCEAFSTTNCITKLHDCGFTDNQILWLGFVECDIEDAKEEFDW